MTLRNKINGVRAIWRFDNRLSLIAGKLLSASGNLEIYRYGNVEFVSDHSAGDANGARDVIFSGMYRRLLEKISLPERPQVLDLGANNGGFPLMLKSLGINPAKVVSVELNPETASRLRFNLERNFENNAVALNAAVCGERRTIEVSLGSGSTSDNIYAVEGQGSRGRTREISGRTLDDFYDDFFAPGLIDLCKIDVEGAEFEIFNGVTDTAAARCRYIIIEIHSHVGKSPQSVIDRLKGAGMTLVDGPSEDNVYLFANENLNER